MSKKLMDQALMPHEQYSVPEVVVFRENDDPQHMSYSMFVAKLFKPFEELDARLDHVSIGLAGEVGELIDELKQQTMYGKELDLAKVKIEAGDLLFYLQGLCNEFGWNFDELTQANTDKLTKRYAKLYFTDAQALERADGEAKGVANGD